LERITGRSLGSDQVDALVQRTEGWAAGLQLAGMMLRVHDDSDGFISRLSGNDRLIADYLSEEVLASQSAERRAFLLRISVLDEMCADLAVRLTGETRAQLVLEDLERESMFLVPLDDRREWYRFHHLFRDLLRFRLRAENPGLDTELLTEAATWHLERGEVNLAVEYLLRAQCWAEALDLIMGRGAEIFERGQMATVIRWITDVPETARAGRRDVSLLLAWLKGAEGQAAGAEDILRTLVADPATTPGERACGQALLATMAQFRSNPDITVAMAHTALELLVGLDGGPIPVVMNLSDPQSLQTMVLGSCGRGHFLAGRLEEAREWMQRGLDSAGVAYSAWRIGILGSLGLVEAWCGRLERAEALADEALGVAREVGILTHPITADAYLAASLVALERGEPRRAALALREGCLRAEANRRIPLVWIGRLLSAELQAAEGRPDEAMATIGAARRDLGAPPPPVVESALVALRSRLLRLGGAPNEAWHVLRDEVDSPALLVETAAAALATGRIDQARKLLVGTPWSDSEPRPTVERHVLAAWLASAEGFPEDAGRSLREAMETASVHRLVEVFVRAGPVVVKLVADHDGLAPDFRHAVLARARDAMAPVAGGDLADPLTDRELEILSYLPSRLTNTELAEKCYVSVNTIKTHMAHIYRKLDVANRNEAIIRARQLGLL
jgi:LuxR family maltose regulon positive regulatory protein